MKKSSGFFLLLTCLLLVPAVASGGDSEIIGSIDGQPVSIREMSLVKYLQWHRKKKELYDLEFQYFEDYVFKLLLERTARAQDLDPEEYLRVKILSQIPPVTNGEVDEYLKKNERLLKESPRDVNSLRKKIKEALLEDKKKQMMLALKKDLFGQAKLVFNNTVSTPRLKIEAAEDDHRIGPEDPKVEVVAFFDLMCPYSRKAFFDLLAVGERFKEDISLVFKHFPMEIHENAGRLAVEAECAGRQGAFFEYAGGVFKLTVEEGCPDCAEKLVGAFKLDPALFRECLETNNFAEKIGRDINMGKSLGITIVPTVFFNGLPVIGHVPRERLIELVEHELNRVDKSAP